MTEQEAVQEVGWVAREARRICSGEALRSEVVTYFERKAALLEFIAGTLAGQERSDTCDLAAQARDEAEHLRGGLEWPRGGQTIGLDVL